jgi:hypothetical protein
MNDNRNKTNNKKRNIKKASSEFGGILNNNADSKIISVVSKLSRPAFLSFIVLLPVCLLWEGIKIATLGNLPLDISVVDKFLSTMLGAFLFFFILTIINKMFFSIIRHKKIYQISFAWILFFMPLVLLLVAHKGYLLSANSFLFAAAGDSARSFEQFGKLLETAPFLPSIPMNFAVTSFFFDWKDIVKLAEGYLDITSLLITLIIVLIASANAFYFNLLNKGFAVFCMVISAFGILFSLTLGVLPDEVWKQSRNIIIIQITLLSLFLIGLTGLYKALRDEAIDRISPAPNNTYDKDGELSEYQKEQMKEYEKHREKALAQWIPPNAITFFILLVLAGPVIMLVL